MTLLTGAFIRNALYWWLCLIIWLKKTIFFSAHIIEYLLFELNEISSNSWKMSKSWLLKPGVQKESQNYWNEIEFWWDAFPTAGCVCGHSFSHFFLKDMGFHFTFLKKKGSSTQIHSKHTVCVMKFMIAVFRGVLLLWFCNDEDSMISASFLYSPALACCDQKPLETIPAISFSSCSLVICFFENWIATNHIKNHIRDDNVFFLVTSSKREHEPLQIQSCKRAQAVLGET